MSSSISDQMINDCMSDCIKLMQVPELIAVETMEANKIDYRTDFIFNINSFELPTGDNIVDPIERWKSLIACNDSSLHKVHRSTQYLSAQDKLLPGRISACNQANSVELQNANGSIFWSLENESEQKKLCLCFNEENGRMGSNAISDIQLVQSRSSEVGGCSVSECGRYLLLICTESRKFKEEFLDNLGEQLEAFDETTFLMLVSLMNEGMKTTRIELPASQEGMKRFPLKVIWNPACGSKDFFVTYLEIPTNCSFVGLKFCINRETHIARGQVDGEQVSVEKILTRTDLLAKYHYRSLVMGELNDGSSALVFLRLHLPAKPHFQCMELCVCLNKNEAITLIDEVDTCVNDFAGIESDLVNKCFLSTQHEQTYIVFSSACGFWNRMYAVRVDQKQSVICIDPLDTSSTCRYSYRVWSVSRSNIFATRASVCDTISILVGSVSSSISNIAWRLVQQFNADIPSNSLTLWTTWVDEAKGEYALIKTHDALGVLVCAHGGPNGRFALDPMSLGPLFISIARHLQLDILLLNYVGSSGYGSSGPKYLAGKVGLADVQSCVALILSAKREHGTNWRRWFYSGGSHGGFLGLCLLANDTLKQNQIQFSAAILRNPVCDPVHLLFTSDIADYVHYQYLCSQYSDPITTNTQTCLSSVSGELLQMLWERSPLKVIGSVKTPCLFMLGKHDKRVPYQNGLNCYKMLKALGVHCKLLLYEDNHALDKNATIRLNATLQSLLWLKQHAQ